MSTAEVLNQEEIDALLNGVDNGAIVTGAAPEVDSARAYDFGRDMRVIRGRMSALEMINERLARQLRVSLYDLLRRSIEISVAPVRMKKFSEYTHSLNQPTSFNLVRVHPLRGTALFVLDPKLVFAVVDNFFGGNGRVATIEGRDFTATEMRIVRMLVTSATADMREAWQSLAKIEVEYLSSESNPQFVNVVSPSDAVVVSTFKIEVDGSGGELHITLPYTMIEPLRDVLDSGVHGQHAEQDERWQSALREELYDAEIELVTTLGRGTLRLSQLGSLKPGDVIPFDFAGQAVIDAEGVPLFRGAFGISRGQQAVRYDSRVLRNRVMQRESVATKKS
jgi:flagellar motor switch protein FliM